MNRFWGSLSSYLIAVILIAGGVGGFIYLNHKSAEPAGAAVDISVDTGKSWDSLTEGEHVVLNANNCAGYTTHTVEKGVETSRLYYVFDYSQKTNNYSKVIMVYVEPKDYAAWDALEKQKLSPKEQLKTITVDNYARKMTAAELRDARNVMLTGGVFDMDEIQQMIVPYMIAPMEENKANPIYKILAYAAMALGGIFLVGSIIGSVANR